jgi:superfamily II DNA or RNA helicase
MSVIKDKPRPYQKNALIAMADQFITKRSTDAGIIVLPTGAGKTFIASYFNTEVIRQLGLKIIWVAHRDELIKQAIESHLKAEPSLRYTQWIANKKDATGDVIFTSIQSTRGLVETLEALYGTNINKFVLAIDECHHFSAPDESTGYSNMYADLFTSMKNGGMLSFCYGLTATIERLDGKPLGFKTIVYQMKFTDGVREGFLASPMLYEMRTRQEFHLDTVEKANGKRDYTDADLRQLDNPIRNKKIAQEYIRHAVWRTEADGSFKTDDKGNKIHGWGKTLIFAVNVSHCYHLAEEFKLLNPDIDVKVITGGTNDVERHDFKSWLEEGDRHTPKVAINCQIFVEGYDEPTINTIFLTRPTKSESLWMQMVGRGARIIRDPTTGEVTKDRFNLVSVMDEIGRYGALVKDWSLSLINDNQPKTARVKKQRKTKIRAKRKLISQLMEKEGTNDVTLSEAELIDVQAILIYSTRFSNTEGIPLDRDRIDCLRLLKDYLQNCFVEEMLRDGTLSVNLDMDAFRNSYSHCVPANEFDHDTWRRIAWAYYFHYVRRQKYIRNSITGRMQPTWKFVPMVAREDIDSPEAVVAAEQRIASVQENSSKKNEEFNLKYGGRTGAKNLYEFVLDALAHQGMSSEVLFITEHATRIIAQDRRLEVKLKYKIVNDKDENIKKMSTLNKKGTEILQLHIQDSVGEFRLTPAST